MAGYIGKSLATGGTAVDAYSKAQIDANYLKLAGGVMTGGLRQDVTTVTVSANDQTTTISAGMQVVLITTAAYTGTIMQLPGASTVGGQVYRFVKADAGAGKISIARAGSDTIGINANLTMELWFHDNYVDLMSDGTSRWIVMSTEMFTIPGDLRNPNGSPSGGTTEDTWTDADYSTGNQIVPAGTSHIQLYSYLSFYGDGVNDLAAIYFRKNGSDNGRSNDSAGQYIYRTNHTDNQYLRTSTYPIVECDIGRIFEWNLYSSQGSATLATYLYARGFRLG